MRNRVTSTEDVYDSLELSPICRTLKPILYSMKLFGVFFLDSRNGSSEETSSNNQKCASSFWKWFCVCSTVVSGLNILRYIPSFWVGLDYVPDLTVWRIINLSWLMQCFSNRVFMLRACWSPHHLQNLFHNSNSIILADTTTCSSNASNDKCDRIKKIVRRRTVLTWIGASISFTGITIQSLTDFNAEFDTGITNPFPSGNTVSLFVFLILHLWETGAWLFPILFQVTLFTFLNNKFSSVNNDIFQLIEDKGGNISDHLKDIRRRHLQLCKTLTILEQDTQYLLAGTYVTNVFLICFIVYELVATGALPVFVYVSFSAWMTMILVTTVIVSVTAARVNEQAHSPLENIYDVDMSTASAFESLELQMFLSKLNGPAIGFTVMGFVTVTKDFILTLGGLVLTYFFLLFQFKL